MKIDISKIKTVEFEKGLKLCADIKSSFDNNEAYVVGGCVRDILRAAAGQTEYPEIHDVDIATNMPMDMLIRRYKTASNNGEAHGTMLVFMGDIPFEVTQFRTDGTYSDGRHPDSVTFAKTFDEDVKRRDFTINAIGIDGDGTIIDPVNGVTDINNKLIRAVGNPRDRFREDALRIIRGIRFAINFGYQIEHKTREAMREMAYGLATISAERIRGEILKLDKSNGNFSKFIDVLDDINAIPYLRQFKNIDLKSMVWDAAKVWDFNNDNIFPFILLYSDDYQTSMHFFACTANECRKFKWYKKYKPYMAMRSSVVSWSILAEIYSGDYEFLFKLFNRTPDWKDREGIIRMILKESPVDKKAISKRLQESGIEPGPLFGEALRDCIEAAYFQKSTEIMKDPFYNIMQKCYILKNK
jgi:tRNA nucleotidyltransferase/poly(A) polymerase